MTASLDVALLPLPGITQIANADAAETTREAGTNPHWLESGLTALANTSRGAGSDGHFGAAAIAAWRFAREQELDEPIRARLRPDPAIAQSCGLTSRIWRSPYQPPVAVSSFDVQGVASNGSSRSRQSGGCSGDGGA